MHLTNLTNPIYSSYLLQFVVVDDVLVGGTRLRECI